MKKKNYFAGGKVDNVNICLAEGITGAKAQSHQRAWFVLKRMKNSV